MEKYKRKSVFSELKKYDGFAKEHDYIEVCEWHNVEGYDIDINGRVIRLTRGELRAIKKLVKALEK